MRLNTFLYAALSAVTAGCISVNGIAAEGDGAAFFAGKTINVVIGYPPGGGYDVYGRLVAHGLPKYLAGSKSLVQYMPGAATEVATRYIMEVAPQDGTFIGLPASSIAMSTHLQDTPREGIKVNSLQWIGRLDVIDTVVSVWHGSGVRSLADTLNRPLTLGGTNTTTTSFIVPTALVRLKKLNARIVMGYGGANDAFLAMERGEIDGTGLSVWSQLKRTKPDWISGNKVSVLYQMLPQRAADLTHVPSLVDLATDDNQRRIFQLLSSDGTVGRSFYVAQNVPSDRVAALRRAFSAMVIDREFLAYADALQTTINPLGGEELQNVVNEISNYPRELYQEVRKLTAP